MLLAPLLSAINRIHCPLSRNAHPQEFISPAAAGLMEVLKKMWADSWGVRMEHILRNVLLALLEHRFSLLRPTSYS